MYFDYLEEHEMLRDATRGHVERHDPITLLRMEPPLPADARRAAYRQDAQQGWTAMLVPEADGGFGTSPVEAMVVAEELGRSGHGGAFVATNIAAAALASAGSMHQRSTYLDRLIAGEAIVAWIPHLAALSDGRKKAALTLKRHGAAWIVDGIARLIQDADIAEAMIVDLGEPGRMSRFLVPADTPGLAVRKATTIEVSRQLCDVEFNGVRLTAEQLLGSSESADAAILHDLDIAATLIAADSVGLASRMLDMTVAYTKEREAFGKPLAGFQAIRHRCADMLTQVETSRVAVWYAAVAVRDGRDRVHEATSTAKFFATEAGAAVAGDALQLHGGIGMTWEHDLHFFIKRAKANELMWGTNSVHRDRVARELAF